MACEGKPFFVFDPITRPASYTRTVKGDAGKFTEDSRFRNAASGNSAKLKEPQPLPAAPGETHVVTIIIFFVADCEVTIEAECAGQKYCRKESGKANKTVTISHSLPMAKEANE